MKDRGLQGADQVCNCIRIHAHSLTAAHDLWHYLASRLLQGCHEGKSSTIEEDLS